MKQAGVEVGGWQSPNRLLEKLAGSWSFPVEPRMGWELQEETRAGRGGHSSFLSKYV